MSTLTPRPVYHYTPPEGSINDPNGLIYHDGAYHLFYQKNWGAAWGHARSSDLFHWESLPDAFERDALGHVASGSAVIDASNTAGLGAGAMVACYTAWNEQQQCLASSTDGGQTWQKLPDNPVLPHGHRDPKVFWHEDSAQWVMILYDSDGFSFFTSPDLRNWDKRSHLNNGFFECPDLFRLPTGHGQNSYKWVLISGDLAYQIGQFDGSSFKPESDVLQGDWGNPAFGVLQHCFHARHMQCEIFASQTWQHLPQSDQRCIQTAWMPQSNAFYWADGCCGQHSTPCELQLVDTPLGMQLRRWPVREIAGLYKQTWHFDNDRLEHAWTASGVEGGNLLADCSSPVFDLQLIFAPGQAVEIGLELNGIKISIAPRNKTLVCRGHSMPLAMRDGSMKLRVLRDHCSIEIFADEGLHVMSLSAPANLQAGCALYALGGSALLQQGVLHQIA